MTRKPSLLCSRALATALVVISAPLHGQSPPAGPVTAPSAAAARATSPIRVDGRLDEAAWQGASVLGGFVQSEPREGSPVSERTEVRVLFDDAAIYIGAWLFDSEPSAIVFGETRRDASLSDADAFSIILDTYLDRQNGFMFATTPAAIEYDGQVTREGQGGFGGLVRQQRGSGGGFNLNWDGDWQVATSRDANGWYAEFRIPFSTLRYGKSGVQQWGVNFARNIRRKHEEAFWAPLPRQFDLHRVSLAGTLTGIEAPFQRVVSVTPYVLGSARKDYIAGTSVDRAAEFGADAKIGLTPSLTLDLTANTDFAQVEVDDEQINLTRFRLFFPEKRPFFLENAGTFSVGTSQEVEVFFSRRIGIAGGNAVPILGGGRITGKAGGFTVGVLSIQDDGLSVGSDTGVVTVAPRNNFAVGRLLREFPNRTRVGAMVVSRANIDDGNDHNLAYALDGRIGFGDGLTFDGYAAKTATPGASGDDHALALTGSYTSRDWSAGGSLREVGAQFNPEAGFLPRSAYRLASLRVLRNVRPANLPWFRELRPHASYREYFDLDGFSETRLIHLDSHFEFANGAFFQLPAINFTREGLKRPFRIAKDVVVAPGTYDGIEWGFAYNTNLSAPVSLQGRIDIGDFYSGHRRGAGATLNARMGETLFSSVRAEYYDIDLKEGSFETVLLRVRTAYSFTPRIYLQALVQYNNQTDVFSGNLRFGWLSTAGTGLFLVYNDLENTGSFEETRLPVGPIDRTFVLKFTRQFNLGN